MKRIPLSQLKIYIRKLIKPTYFAWGFGVLCFIFAAQTIFVYITLNNRNDRNITKFTYIKDRVSIDKIHTQSDRYIKIVTFYTEIVSVYFQKYHDKYNKKGKTKYQGLNDSQLAKIINLWYRGSRGTSLSYMLLPSIAIRESSGNPLACTYNKDGTILEAGLYNNRREAVLQARRYRNLMPINLQRIFDFYFIKMDDLFDPINATKIEFCLLWGEFVYYKNNQAWAITSSHWGNTKISKLYHNGILPPKDFKFNIGSINEDVRNPFVYYFIINQYISAFERFTVKVRLDTRYDKIYKSTAKKMEQEYINSYKYFNEFVDLMDEIKNDKINYFDKREKNIFRLETKIRHLSKFYKDAHKLLKAGKIKTFKEFWTVLMNDTRKIIKEIEEEKNKDIRIQLKIILISMFFILLIGFISMFVFTVKYFILRKKK